MLKEAQIVENTNYDRRVRQNQINEFRNILEEDKVDSQIAEQLAIDLEQAAYNLSGGENTREYRTRMNTVKMRLKGIKGQWIRVILLDSIMTPSELMQLDMQKFNEETVQTFLIQNNRTLPSKQSFVKKQLPPPPIIKQPVAVQNEIKQNTFVQSNETQQNNQQTNKKKPDQVAQLKFQPIVKEDTFQNSNEIDKLDFTPQEEPIQQFEDIGDYSFEYNQKQSGFIEGNDIEELQLNQQPKNVNQEEDEQIMGYQIGSPLPSDNAINQEFLQDEQQDEIKQTNQNRILDSQIQLEEQFYYDHQCSFQAKNDNTDQLNLDNNDNNQVLSTFGQEENDDQGQQISQEQEKDPHLHTHQLQHCIQQKILEQELHRDEIQTVKEPLTKDNFQEAINSQDQLIEEKIKQFAQEQNELQIKFIQMQKQHYFELQQFQQESIKNANQIQILRNENNLIKQTLQQQEHSTNFQINALKEQEQFERKQFSKILEKQKNLIQNERDFIEQIQFNSNLRREQLFKSQDSYQEINIDDQLNTIQEILIKLQPRRLLTNQQQQQTTSNQQEQVQVQNNNQFQQQSPNQYWASEDDGVVQGALLNADSGSTQIRRTELFNQQDALEEQDHQQQFQQIEEFQPQQQSKPNDQNYDFIASSNEAQQGDQEYMSQIKNDNSQSNNYSQENYWEQQVNNTTPTQQQKLKNKSQRQRHDNVPQSLFD